MTINNDTIYGYCKACDSFVYREVGKTHGDGKIDTDENPIWLTAACVCDAEDHTPDMCNPNCGCPKCFDTWSDNQVDCGCTNH